MERNIFLRVEHIPGMKNIIADKESRTVSDWYNWMIHMRIFAHFLQAMGPLEKDMCGSN